MAKKPRVDRSSSDPGARLGNPFAQLAGLRDALPAGEVRTEPAPPTTAATPATPWPARLVVRRERKGHGGKTVTVVEGFPVVDDTVHALVKDLKRSLGAGARLEGTSIVIQGELDERVRDLLVERGAPRVILGTR